MLIHISTVSGRQHSIDVEPTATIGSVKEELQNREGISAQQQRLLFQGQNLPDESTVESARIKAGDTIHMVLALRAGGF